MSVQHETGGKVLRVVIVGGVGWVVIMEGWSVTVSMTQPPA